MRLISEVQATAVVMKKMMRVKMVTMVTIIECAEFATDTRYIQHFFAFFPLSGYMEEESRHRMDMTASGHGCSSAEF
jgi:hypothetical protein